MNKVITLSFFVSTLLISHQGNTQNQSGVSSSENSTTASHEKKTFVDGEGKIFWNLALPVYLSISTDPEGKSANVLKGVRYDAMKEHTNPMYFDGHGIHYIRHMDYEHQVPENEVAFEVFVDGIKPVSTSAFLEAPKYTKSGVIHYGKGLKASLKSKDELSGVDGLYYKTSDGAFKEYSVEIPFATEGSHVLSYYSVDKVGNTEKVVDKPFVVDLTAPKTDIEMTGNNFNNIYASSVQVKLTSSDALSGVKKTNFQFDSGNELYYSAIFNLTSLQDGDHSITYYSTDKVLNVEDKKEFKFYVDRIAPEVSSEIIGDVHRANGKTYIAGETKVKLTATDNKAGVEQVYYTVNGVSKIDYSEPFKLDANQGNYNISYWSMDKVKNTSKAKTDADVGKLYLDLTAPKISYSYTGPKFYTRDTMFITSTTKINLKASDVESGVNKIAYTFDGGAEKTYETPLSFEPDGFHKLAYEGIDNVNNATKSDFFFIIDNEAPEIYSHLSIDKIGVQTLENGAKEIPVYPKHAMLYLAATDLKVGTDKIYYTIEGQVEREYTQAIKTTKAGLWKVSVRSTDKLGNEQKIESIEFVIQ